MEDDYALEHDFAVTEIVLLRAQVEALESAVMLLANHSLSAQDEATLRKEYLERFAKVVNDLSHRMRVYDAQVGRNKIREAVRLKSLEFQ
ncbi:hypothetical protein [Chryseobacterium sp.]|uniref:hypothetical protein n=1 Tax=Chryseobacterium sp. TaxID=1871047 RepID=UPI0012A7F713|nr:hypothetical protein [Chryseobacterium sp.]QFG53674.1 hypothetical protein F7R58_08945 [Chryseobacterium sp.]